MRLAILRTTHNPRYAIAPTQVQLSELPPLDPYNKEETPQVKLVLRNQMTLKLDMTFEEAVAEVNAALAHEEVQYISCGEVEPTKPLGAWGLCSSSKMSPSLSEGEIKPLVKYGIGVDVCPDCFSTEDVRLIHGALTVKVECTKCKRIAACAGTGHPEDAIRNWNNRTPQPVGSADKTFYSDRRDVK